MLKSTVLTEEEGKGSHAIVCIPWPLFDLALLIFNVILGRQCSGFSDCLRAGRSGNRMPVGRDFPHLYRNNQQNILHSLCCISFTISTSTFFGRYCFHLQGDVITRIQKYKCG